LRARHPARWHLDVGRRNFFWHVQTRQGAGNQPTSYPTGFVLLGASTYGPGRGRAPIKILDFIFYIKFRGVERGWYQNIIIRPRHLLFVPGDYFYYSNYFYFVGGGI
jgi:hypothetical protein